MSWRDLDIAKSISRVGPLDFSGIIKSISLDADGANQVAKNVAVNEISKLNSQYDALGKVMEGMDASSAGINDLMAKRTNIQSQITNLQSVVDNSPTIESVNEALQEVTGKDKMGYLRFAKGYFGDEQYGKNRKIAAAGAGATLAIGGRFLSGGNLTTNAQGERDIVGIPFI